MPRESDDHQKRERELALLLDYLQQTRGLDLSGYKRVGLLRRLTKRMRNVGVEGFADYVDFLEAHPATAARLCCRAYFHVRQPSNTCIHIHMQNLFRAAAATGAAC